jgi:hypothetical protein
VAVPALLPPWPDVEEYPDAHVAGLRAALDRLRRHAEAAVWESRLDGAWADQVQSRVGRLLAEGAAADDYSDGLAAGNGAEDAAVAKDVADQVHTGLERYYLLGQIVAMPRLALNPFPALQAGSSRHPGRPPRLPRPGESGFDPWCLTDPRIVGALRRDRRARRAIDELWERDPDPTRTLTIKAEIDGALVRHDIAYEAGHYIRCPWGPIYLVKQPVRIAARSLRPLEQFTYDVTVEPRRRGWTVRREIAVGPFYPTC